MKTESDMLKELAGNREPLLIAGPCAVEGYEMMDTITGYLVSRKINVIRAGAFKPRTSPASFQGLGIKGLDILGEIRKKYPVKIVSEILDIRYLDRMSRSVDILQVGARNMYNYELLKELGKTKIPILLKRGICATIREFRTAAEYLAIGGNQKILLCERGIRSFDNSTRNLLDIGCVAIIKKETGFPMIVDISHALGRKDIAALAAKAALAAGADGIMVEVHNCPERALSDKDQQMSLAEFKTFQEQIGHPYG